MATLPRFLSSDDPDPSSGEPPFERGDRPGAAAGGEIRFARDWSVALRLSRLATEVVPLFVVTGTTIQLSRPAFGLVQTWLLVVFGVAWLLTAAAALFYFRRGSYVPWSSCTARPVQSICLLALNTLPCLPILRLHFPGTTWSMMLPAEMPSWICGLGVALAIVMMARPMRRTCGIAGMA
jgi:hypothetical protein